MKWKRFAISVLFFLSLILFGSGCFGTDKTGCIRKIEEVRSMIDTTVMDYGDYEVMLPRGTYCAGDEINNIFAVPKDNMIGTNDIDNAIKLLQFESDEKLKHHVLKRGFMEMVTGPFEFRFLPVYSENEIAYSQSKGFLLVDVAKRNVKIHTISPGIYSGDIENISVLDSKNRVFVLEVLRSNGDNDANIWDDKVLKIIRFENDSFTILAERPAGIKTVVYTEPWFVYQKKIFIYNDSTIKLEVFDENFKSTTHPLTEAFNRNQVGFRCMKEMAIHPTMPFALIIERGKPATSAQLATARALPEPEDEKAVDAIFDEAKRLTLYLFCWNEPDEKKRFIPLLSMAGSIWNSYNPANAYSHFTFSPDGKWVVFRDGSMRGDDLNSNINPVFVAVPIDEKNPLFLGKPIKLGNALRPDAIEPKSTAWTVNPTAFVMADGLVIYRWDLDKYKQLSTKKVKMPPESPDFFTN